MAKGRRWTEEEILEAINLYIRTPFGKIHSRNPHIAELASSLNRTVGSVALKMTNLASIDETLDRKGMANVSDLDRSTWKKYFADLMDEARLLDPTVEKSLGIGFAESAQPTISGDPMIGKDFRRLTNVRDGQKFFREMILASYDQKCAITGISQPSLLVAGHIRPWSIDVNNRLNPRNGICLNRLHDKAFEEHLIAIEGDGEIIYSKKLNRETKEKMRRMSQTGYFHFPTKFKPDPAFLADHREHFIE